MRKLYDKTLVVIILFFFTATAQQLSPPIQNYSSLDYNAASQNWDIALNDKGVLYAANSQGLLSYDGQRWSLFPLESGSIVRSVYPYKERIYTGSYREFGYWEKDSKGDMCYTSLIPLLGDYDLQSEEFWEIMSYKGAIFFRSFGAIYRYANNKITILKRMNVNQMEVFNDRIVVATGNSGLFYLGETGELEPLPDQEILKGEAVRELILHGDKLLIGIKNGIFKFNGSKIERLKNKRLEQELALYELNHVLSLAPEELLIGTLKSGIIHYNESTGNISLYNRQDGLQNNTVLSMTGRNGKVWLGLDNGIDAVEIHSPINFFTDQSGELGSVYDIELFEGNLYLASNTGVFKLEDQAIRLLPGSEGHCWNLEVYDGVLYSNHNNGTYKVERNELIPVSNRTGSFDLLDYDRNKFLIGTYTGIDSYNEATGEVKRLKGINVPVKNMLLEKPEILWATGAYEGIYRIGFSKEGDSRRFVNKISSDSLKGDYNAEIHLVRNQIVVLSNGEWYRYDPFKDQLEKLLEWQAYSDNRLLAADEDRTWFINSAENALEITDFEDHKILVSAEMLGNRLVKGHERLVKEDDSIYFITLHDGFARINLEELNDFVAREEISQPIVQKLYDDNRYYDLNGIPHIGNREAKEITILAGLPVSNAVGMTYELTGKDNSPIRGKVEDGKIQFQNLPYDEYDLLLTAVGSQDDAAVQSTFRFVVDPPWYFQSYMKIFYLLLVGLIFISIYYFNRRKLEKHRQVLRIKFQKEHEEQMNRIEKEQLLNEINLKRKELANSTMMAAKKNEVLMQIQGELNKEKSNFSNQYRRKHIMNKINNAVKNDDEWKVFETNFNELHEDFFKDLLAAYPQLTNRDLKLCSYLKMNLPSKEIAPLMGISVRGVEVHRYRLRKKLGVDNSKNLTNWLISSF